MRSTDRHLGENDFTAAQAVLGAGNDIAAIDLDLGS
jgi:hypothetical protein